MVGYGFVEFIAPELAKEVLQNLNEKLISNYQKTFKLNPATYSLIKLSAWVIFLVCNYFYYLIKY